MEENKNEIKEENLEEINEENSGIQISNDVVAVIAGVAVSEVRGVASMQGGFAGGIGEVLSGKKNLAKGIKVEAEDGKVKIDVNVHVQGVSIETDKKQDENQKENDEQVNNSEKVNNEN